MEKQYSHIIFDCDGTLVDSEYPNNLALCQILAEHGADHFDLDYAHEHWVGNTLTDIFKDLRARHRLDFPDDIIKRCIARSQQLYDTHLTPIPGALECVAAVSGRYKICVASNGERNNVFKSLSLSGYDTYFNEETIFTRIQVPRGKPAPDLFLYAAEKMQAAPGEILVIEDSISGVAGAVAAGMDVWGFTGVAPRPERQEKALLETGAARVYSSLIHIQEALGA
jgi:HAD superfamily hydrolase (TIGR01509 family)